MANPLKSWLTKVASQEAGSILDKAADVADRFIENPEEKKEFLKQAFEAEREDRANARDLYAKDSSIQKIYAMTFLIGYLLVTGILLWWAFADGEEQINDFQISLISTIFGAMSVKLNTITEYFFGGSVQSEKAIKDVSKQIKK